MEETWSWSEMLSLLGLLQTINHWASSTLFCKAVISALTNLTTMLCSSFYMFSYKWPWCGTQTLLSGFFIFVKATMMLVIWLLKKTLHKTAFKDWISIIFSFGSFQANYLIYSRSKFEFLSKLSFQLFFNTFYIFFPSSLNSSS